MYLLDYERICEMIDEVNVETIKALNEKAPPANFGTPIHVLLMGDRFLKYTEAIRYYMQSSIDIEVQFAVDHNSALKVILEKPIDFLIMIGAFKNNDSYHAVKDFHFINKYSVSIACVIVDDFFTAEMFEFGILYGLNILMYPPNKLIQAMREYYDKETKRMHKEVSRETTREHLRLKALAKYYALQRSRCKRKFLRHCGKQENR